jgi:hypothetical protein
VIKLRLVGSSTDLDHLVFTSRKTGGRGSHILVIDDKLFRTLEDVVRKRRAAKSSEPARKQPAQEPKLTPPEVQRLLRAGRSVEQVAKMAGTDVAWVERFLGPVLDERAGAIQSFQRTRLDKPRLGASGLPLGESVERNLRTRRVKLTPEELDRSWDASRLNTQGWVITLTFPFRGREQRAVWKYDPRTREAVAGNRLAGDLGWVPDGRRPVRPSPATPAGAGQGRAKRASATRPKRGGSRRSPAKASTRRRTPTPKPRATQKRRAPARRAAPRRSVSKRGPARARRAAARKPRRTPARRPATKRPAARRTAARRTAARRPAARRPAARRTAARRPAARRTAARRSTARRRTAR